MNNTEQKPLVENLRESHKGQSPEQLLRYFLETFKGRIALSSSMSAEDQVLTDMICRVNPSTQIFTLDTGRLPEETYNLIDQTKKKYGISIRVLFPDRREVEDMIADHGPNLFLDSVEKRKTCCRVRKIEPLKRMLKELDVWICGLRKEQSVTRVDLEPIQWDEQFGLIKLSPLLDFTNEQVWDYIHKHNVPYSALHDQGYTSIGCSPCTRPIAAGEDLRAGRWWWEEPEHKECGLHLDKKTSERSV